MIVEYDESGTIGKRYLRAATYGTPFAVTIDDTSVKNKDITIRDRDSEKQIRVKIKDLRQILIKLANKEIEFTKAGKLVK